MARWHISTEFAFLLSGVFIMIVAWALNLLGTMNNDQSSGHGMSDVYLWLFLMFQGLGFSSVGVIGANYREFIANPALGRRYAVGFLLIADGGLHLLALNEHLAFAPQATFFAIIAPIQIVGGILFINLPRRLDPIWLLFTVFLIGAFVVTRTLAVWPIGFVEEVDPLGVISKGLEVATSAMLVVLVRARYARKSDRHSTTPAHGP
ncbi:MAG: hypothetical protein E6K19_04820 [Methanobacteriota archaeon]|nr:MAG: hypothetical protein E6K19_04820 [Euryarchaeota archaeon]